MSGGIAECRHSSIRKNIFVRPGVANPPPRGMRTIRFFPLLLTFALPMAAAPAADLTGLLKDYDESQLQLYPSEGLWRGDNRFLDRYEDNLTASHLAERRRLNTGFRARLAAIE